ncbi:unnamed protein product [Cyprideis torosa]|uniref:Lysophospholipid acyltransferase 5 n=1 Tax=Cyprideis torosa TaxID=163714 RepID=A0A7R8ZP14_9CRUS|nr:unnamed protein product [Cyprideis torosa]CAG0899338.1 unnamed protein product [Cyprideis torosa]
MASPLQPLADYLEMDLPGLRLLLSFISGYALAFAYRQFVRGSRATVQHLYFMVSGMSLVVFNYGVDLFHSLFCILSFYGTLLVLGPTLVTAVITFAFQTSYLLIGYYFTETETYDIKWTMPHCVLTLRLIAVAFDVYDGHRPPKELSKEQQRLCISDRMSLLELLAHCYYPTAVLVGPQFSLRHYRNYISGDLYKSDFNPATTGATLPVDFETAATKSPEIPPTTRSAMAKFGVGFCYIVFYQYGRQQLPYEYIFGPEFKDLNFFWKVSMIFCWGKVNMAKYILCWLLQEGASIVMGIGYSGTDKDGHHTWKAFRNIDFWGFETASEYTDMIKVFNINTNTWVARYVYKRLRFLNNRHLSQLGALVFLALWHGFHSGYYVIFFNEFVVVNSERAMKDVFTRNSQFVWFFSKSLFRYPWFVLKRLFLWTGLTFAVCPFLLLSYDKWFPIYCSLYFYWYILYIPGNFPIFIRWLSDIVPPDLDVEGSSVKGPSPSMSPLPQVEAAADGINGTVSHAKGD